MTEAVAVPSILIAEADDNIAAALQFIVVREGMRCERIESGSGAVDQIRRMRPDIVMLDVMLPDISGYEICREVREDPKLESVKIVMMIARGSARDRQKALAFGANGFVIKPFNLPELRRELHRLTEFSSW